MKLVPGNRVLLRGPNNPMMAACWFGIIKAGCIAVATMPLLRAKELEVIVDKARIGAALCDVRLKDELEIARTRCRDLKRVLLLQRRRRRLARGGARAQAGRSSRTPTPPTTTSR